MCWNDDGGSENLQNSEGRSFQRSGSVLDLADCFCSHLKYFKYNISATH